ncbi:MAG: sulfatase [Candidatus Hinthialibacter antarcticus]|nr:sulfatase [Candidatus Hinthialibacter antarcticus]
MALPITRRAFTRQFAAASGALALNSCATMQQTANHNQTQMPNIVIIYTDDQGWADIGVNGAEGFETPNLDRMAAEGVRFTDFYVAQPVCGASRTALLTGCYPNRVGILGAPGPGSKIGINDNEMLISELLKQKDYATAIFGKWHLGDHSQFLPLQHGFDEYYGLPYSNDMWPFHPETDSFPKLPLIEGNEIIEYNPDQTQLTRDYTFRAMNFIEKNHQRPFFLYLAHSMPHVPLHVSDNFRGKSKHGLYGDVMMEIDWSVGRVMSSLRRFGLTENTLVIFASDNGPWVSYGDHAGSAGPLREAKGTTWDGGVRTPCLMRWPGTLPAGHVCNQPAMTIDILPTVAGLTGTRLPHHPIDGLDILPLMNGTSGAQSPHEALYFYWNKNLEAVRSENWSLHLPHPYRTLNGRPGGRNGMPAKYQQGRTELALFDLSNDVGQQRDVSKQNPHVVKRLLTYADQAKADLGHGDQKGAGQRPPGRRPEA